jgi:hypothetical protein
VAFCVKPDFAELYRRAFAEPDPQVKQSLLQQVQSLIDTWHVEERRNQLMSALADEPRSDVRRVAA